MILYQISIAISAELETSKMNWDFRPDQSDQSDPKYQRNKTVGYKEICLPASYEAIIDGLRLFQKQVVGILVHTYDIDSV